MGYHAASAPCITLKQKADVLAANRQTGWLSAAHLLLAQSKRRGWSFAGSAMRAAHARNGVNIAKLAGSMIHLSAIKHSTETSPIW